jgi:hypothetical protein
MPLENGQYNYNDGWDEFRYWNSNPSDATNVRTDDGFRMKDTINSRLQLTKGRWRLTISKPNGPVTNFLPKSDVVGFLDDNDEFQLKAYSVDAVSYNPLTDKLEVEVDIKQNPIPLFIIYAAVIGVSAVLAAMSVDSVLEKVEQVVTNIPKELGKSPFAWGILLIFLLPVVVMTFSKIKNRGA